MGSSAEPPGPVNRDEDKQKGVGARGFGVQHRWRLRLLRCGGPLQVPVGWKPVTSARNFLSSEGCGLVARTGP